MDNGAILKRLADVVGPQVRLGQAVHAQGLLQRDFGTMPPSKPNLVVRPRTTEEVLRS